MNTVQFSVSGRNLNCKDIVKDLIKCNISSSVTENITTVCNSQKCWIEQGCRIITSDMDTNKIKNIWGYLNFKYKLNCCHLKIENDYQGCIKDFIRKSECKIE